MTLKSLVKLTVLSRALAQTTFYDMIIEQGSLAANGANLLAESQTAMFSNIEQIADHGCWCRRLGGSPPVQGADPIDAVDSLCRDWFSKRRCLGLTGGACASPGAEGNAYTVSVERYTASQYAQSVTNVACNAVDSCGESTCLVDTDMISQLSDFINRNPVYQNNAGFIPNSNAVCTEHITEVPEKECSGDAPNVEVIDATPKDPRCSAYAAQNGGPSTVIGFHSGEPQYEVHEFQPADGSYTKYFMIPLSGNYLNYAQCKSVCATGGADVFPVSIKSEEENDFVGRKAFEVRSNPDSGPFLGMQRCGSTWCWEDDGSEVDYANWYRNCDGGRSGQNIMSLNVWGYRVGTGATWCSLNDYRGAIACWCSSNVPC